MSFAEMVRKSRKEIGLSQEELADELGVSRQSIAKWESELDVGYPEMRMALLLSTKLGVPLDVLFKDELEQMQELLLTETRKKQQNDEENEISKGRRQRRSLVNAAIDEMRGDIPLAHVETGFGFIDKGPYNFNRCGLHVLFASGSSVSKGGFALKITLNILKNNGAVSYFITKASAKRYTRILLEIETGISTSGGKKLSQKDILALQEAGNFIENSKLTINDAFNESVESIYEKSVNSKIQQDLIVVEGADELFSSSKGSDTKHIYEVLRRMSWLCRCPVLLLTQAKNTVREMIKNEEPLETLMNEVKKDIPMEWNDGLMLLYTPERCERSEEDYNTKINMMRQTYEGDVFYVEGKLNFNRLTREYAEVCTE